MAIVFAALLNLVAIDRGGSRLTKGTAVLTNALMLYYLFCLYLPNHRFNAGIFIFLITKVAFI